MKRLLAAPLALALTIPASAQDDPAPSPNQIVESAKASDWVAIPAEDLLVMTLAPDVQGNERQVVIQLMPPPFSQGWVENIRTLVRTGWYDGISINRVQDNYVVQWGDPNVDNPEAEGEAKPLPEGLKNTRSSDYVEDKNRDQHSIGGNRLYGYTAMPRVRVDWGLHEIRSEDAYAPDAGFVAGWPVASDSDEIWPVHCYGTVGVGRGYSPDAGSGAELYTVIGHAPRHLDRNIGVVGRVVEGIEHLSSLPRGKGALGFYADVTKRVPVRWVRLASDLPIAEQPRLEFLSTKKRAFRKYADARANRRDPWFIEPAGGADICNIPVPVRRVAAPVAE
ncbi:peptidylprolyl isomerase [Qipengyuania sp. DSG2-2]|uniref:peptidylprolyl isomerase n=1 Tax=Qipengyuania sp. DGS2-2 TaxID=3349631 RepID=UPI0036D38DE4